MLPLVYTDVIYTCIFVFVFGAWAISEFLGPVRWSKEREGEKRDRGSIMIGAVAGSLGVVLSFLFPVFVPGAAIPWQAAAFFGGIALSLVGVIWRWYAIHTLGQYFTVTVMIQDHQPVVQHGPYKLIRHPSYTGVLVVVLGFGLMEGNWASAVAITTGLFISLLYRIRVEEEALVQGIGEPYETYKKRTKRLIPYLF